MIAAKSTSMAIRARPLATTPGAAHGEVLAAAAGMKASGSNSAPMAATSGIYFPICSAAAVVAGVAARLAAPSNRSEEHTSELQSLMRISYAVFCLQQKKQPD